MGKILEISLPSVEVKEQIKEEAARRGCCASKFILAILEGSRLPAPSTGPGLEYQRPDQNCKMNIP